MPPFNVISRRSTPEIVLSRFQNSASKIANCIIVDIVNYLMLLLAKSYLIFSSFHNNMELG